MKSRRTSKFKKAFAKLPDEVQELARKNFRLWLANPGHPGLNFELIDDQDRIWSARVGLHYRALGVEADGVYIWFWIGTHAEYDRLID